MKARPQPLNNFSGQICNDEYRSKNSKNFNFNCIMNAFFDERKYGDFIDTSIFVWISPHKAFQ